MWPFSHGEAPMPEQTERGEGYEEAIEYARKFTEAGFMEASEALALLKRNYSLMAERRRSAEGLTAETLAGLDREIEKTKRHISALGGKVEEQPAH